MASLAFGLTALLVSCSSLMAPAPTLRPASGSFPPGNLSTFTVPVTVPMVQARQWAEGVVPPTLDGAGSGQRTLSAWFVKKDWHYSWTYHLKRTALKLSFGGDKVRVSTGLYGELAAQWDTLPGDISSDVEAEAGAEAQLQVTPEWRLKPQVQTFLDVRRADVPIGISFDGNFFGETISVAGPVQAALKPALTSVNAELERWIGGLELRPTVEGLWRDASEPRSLAGANLWFSLNPESVAFGPLVVDAQKASLPLTLGARPTLTVGTKPNASSHPLPAAQSGPAGDGALTIDLPVNLEWTEATTQALAALGTPALLHPSTGGQILVKALSASTDGDRVIVRLEGLVSPPWPGPAIEAVFYLTGTPKWSASTRTLQISGVGLETKTKDVIAQGASWLLNGAWTQALEKALVWNLGPAIDDLKAKASSALQTVPLGPHLALHATLATLEVRDIVVTDRGPQILTRLSGTAEAAWLP